MLGDTARSLLAPVAFAFQGAAHLRSKLYEKNIIRSVKLSKPVISIGNLTVGGTGKTPVVDVVLSQLESRGLRCAVLTRGYGRSSEESFILDSNTTPQMGGDEPVWLYQRHPLAKIAVGADRVASAQKIDADVFILDDGLQHLEIQRDLEITLIDVSRPLWHYHPLPWGYAREGWEALKRSDLVILTRVNQAEPEMIEEIAHHVFAQSPNDVIESTIAWGGCFDLITGQEVDVAEKKVFICSAIGNPQSFYKTVQDTGVRIVGFKEMRDHAPILIQDIHDISKAGGAIGADMILITEKDAVKWRPCLGQVSTLADVPVAVVKTKLSFEPGLPILYDLITHHLR